MTVDIGMARRQAKHALALQRRQPVIAAASRSGSPNARAIASTNPMWRSTDRSSSARCQK